MLAPPDVKSLPATPADELCGVVARGRFLGSEVVGMSLAARIYTTGELAMMLLVSSRTVRKWIDGGKLPASHTDAGKHRRVTHADLLGFLETHWPEWREGLRQEYTASLQGSAPEWWRGVVRGWLQRRPGLRDWLALLGCEQEFSGPETEADRPCE